MFPTGRRGAERCFGHRLDTGLALPLPRLCHEAGLNERQCGPPLPNRDCCNAANTRQTRQFAIAERPESTTKG